MRLRGLSVYVSSRCHFSRLMLGSAALLPKPTTLSRLAGLGNCRKVRSGYLRRYGYFRRCDHCGNNGNGESACGSALKASSPRMSHELFVDSTALLPPGQSGVTERFAVQVHGPPSSLYKVLSPPNFLLLFLFSFFSLPSGNWSI